MRQYVDPKNMKIGDKVVSRQHEYMYEGIIADINSDNIEVKVTKVSEEHGLDPSFSVGGLWKCHIEGDRRVATASGCWDHETYLEKASGASSWKCGKEEHGVRL